MTCDCWFSVFRPPPTPTSIGPSSPPTTPISPGAPAGAAKHTCNHLHTIGAPGSHSNTCTRCSQKKWPRMMRNPPGRKTEQRRSHLGEVTVLAVGRCVRLTRKRKNKKQLLTLPSTDFTFSLSQNHFTHSVLIFERKTFTVKDTHSSNNQTLTLDNHPRIFNYTLWVYWWPGTNAGGRWRWSLGKPRLCFPTCSVVRPLLKLHRPGRVKQTKKLLLRQHLVY